MAKIGKAKALLGSWAFLIGVILAVILGSGLLWELSSMWLGVLVVIGIIVGLFNITDKEVMPFLLSGAVLVIVSSQGQMVMGDIPMLNGILSALLAIFVPATIIVAIKNVFSLAKS
jgi:hypothetical protein